MNHRGWTWERGEPNEILIKFHHNLETTLSLGYCTRPGLKPLSRGRLAASTLFSCPRELRYRFALLLVATVALPLRLPFFPVFVSLLPRETPACLPAR